MNARLIESHEIAPKVRHFVFEAEGVQRLDFVPGQFVSFTLDVEGKPITRAYSIANAPGGTNRFELCLNEVEGGRLSPRLFAMAPGDVLDMKPPLGMFVMPEPPRDALFVATGTGVAPFRAMLQAQLPKGSPAITLLFGVRYESHILYRAEFEAMAVQYPQFRFWPTLTRPGEGWAGRKGRVQAHLAEAIDTLTGEGRDIDVFLCGMKEMVNDVRSIVKGMGFDRKQIRYEKYD